jgi:hypothetical protein
MNPNEFFPEREREEKKGDLASASHHVEGEAFSFRLENLLSKFVS